jgi:flagellar motility protein MotE (MotC chaperone)
MKKFGVLFTVFFVSVLSSLVFLVGCKKEIQTKKEQTEVTEMKRPGVEGLREFHEVLYPVWHEFLPNGDYESIRKAVPEFKKSIEIVKKAELPLFYQHVKEDFEKKREELALSIEKLDSVAQTGDDKKLEEAVENMHSAFEQMARVLAPRMKEMEEFHLVLYPLWHEAMPNKEYQTIKDAVPSLENKMDALMKAEIPEDFKDIETRIIEKREALGKAVEDLANVCRKNKNQEIIDKLTQMHESYRALDEVFE